MKRLVLLLLTLVCVLPLGCNRTPKRAKPSQSKPWQEINAEKLPVTEKIPTAIEPPAQVGNFGYTPKPEKTQEFLKSLDAPTLPEANPELFKVEENPPPKKATEEDLPRGRAPPVRGTEPVFLYKALYAVSPGWKVGSQGIGDCVSWGYAHGCDVSLAVDCKLGVSGSWKPAATEAIYGGARVEGAGRPEGSGGYSDGSYGAAAAKWLSTKGGVVYRGPFTESPINFGYDLTKYDKSRAKSWGNWGCGGQGDNGKLDKVATDHPVLQVALVRNFTEAAAAISSGYPVPVCSGQGFSSVRDKDGFAAASGSWSHCMCFTGVRYEPRPGLLCQNSWGAFNSGPKYPDDQPDGSFWVEEKTATRMLSGGDSFALSHIKGFPKRKLKHSEGW